MSSRIVVVGAPSWWIDLLRERIRELEQKYRMRQEMQFVVKTVSSPAFLPLTDFEPPRPKSGFDAKDWYSYLKNTEMIEEINPRVYGAPHLFAAAKFTVPGSPAPRRPLTRKQRQKRKKKNKEVTKNRRKNRY